MGIDAGAIHESHLLGITGVREEMKDCLDTHGIEGLNQLNDLLRPYLDLRSFYFGVRSILFRHCQPPDAADTSYIQLREIVFERKDEIFSVKYTPIKRAKIARINYSADTRSESLNPLISPRTGGAEELCGYFSKKTFGPIMCVFEDVIASFRQGVSDFKPKELKCKGDLSGSLTREISEAKGISVHTYKLFCAHNPQKNAPSEVISFYFNTSL